MLANRRIIILLIFIAVFSAAYSAGSASTISEQDSKNFIKEFQQVVEGIDAIGIFTHNVTVALPMFVPGFGIAWGSFAAWSTGLAFRALVSTTPALAKLPPLSIIYLSPFGVMELIAYSIGMSRSYLLISAILRRKPLMPLLKPTAIEVGIAVGLLLAGAFIEYTMIQHFGSSLVHPKAH